MSRFNTRVFNASLGKSSSVSHTYATDTMQRVRMTQDDVDAMRATKNTQADIFADVRAKLGLSQK